MDANEQPKPGTVGWLRKQLGLLPDDVRVNIAAGKEREPKTIEWKVQSNEIVII